MGNTVTKWSRVSSGMGTVLDWPHPSNTTPVFTGLCVLYGYYTFITSYIYSSKSLTHLVVETHKS
jgi:hypothetical protein